MFAWGAWGAELSLPLGELEILNLSYRMELQRETPTSGCLLGSG